MAHNQASCHCGNLKLVCAGEPMFVAMCHCQACQRRTGSTYNLGAWFEISNVSISGKSSVYRRTGEQGIELSYHFCPDCGSNVYWTASSFRKALGVAVGCFADPGFPEPTISLYEKRRHSWVSVPENIPCYKASQSKT